MANDLITNINQAVSDFNTIKTAIINKGVDIPNGTPTNQYAEKINNIININFTPTEENILQKIHKNALDYLCKNNFTNVLTESTDVFNLMERGVYLLNPKDDSVVFTNLPSDVDNHGIFLNYRNGTSQDKACVYFPFNEDIIIKHSFGGNNNSNIQWLYLKDSDFNNTIYNKEIVKNAIKYMFLNNYQYIVPGYDANHVWRTDWNTFTDTGLYLMSPASNSQGLSMPNFPGSDIFRWGWITVLNLNDIIIQIYYTNHYDQYVKTFTYRQWLNNEWGDWLRITGNWTKS